MASCESTGRELSFEWSHHTVSSADSKVRVALQNSIKGCLIDLAQIQDDL